MALDLKLFFQSCFFRVLEVVLDEISSGEGFQALSSLQCLQELIFFVEVDTMDRLVQCTRSNINRKNFQLCMQHLPGLRFAGERFNHYLPVAFKTLGRATEMELQTRKPWILGLQEATLFRASSIPDGIFLPNLTSLHLLEPSPGVFQWDPRLSAVTELGLYEVSMDTCVKILSQTEQRLKKLILYVKQDAILVDRIFHLCPNLERFSVVLSPSRLNLMTRIEPDTLRHLKVLELIILSDSTSEFVVDPEALMQLLQAPELRHLELTKITLQQREAEEIIRRLQRGEILQKMEHVILHHWHTPASDLYEVASNRTDLVLSTMVLCCPKLTQVFNYTNFYFRGRRNMHPML
jgi:hypothetical protein